jgi:hypothetical protein
MFAHVSGERARIEIIAAPCATGDDQGDLFALVEIIRVLRMNGTQASEKPCNRSCGKSLNKIVPPRRSLAQRESNGKQGRNTVVPMHLQPACEDI